MQTVRDLMTTSVETIGPDASAADLERVLCRLRVTGLPVVDHGKLLGVVTRGDIVRQLAVAQTWAEVVGDYYQSPMTPSVSETLETLDGHQLQTTKVAELMSKELITVPPELSLTEAARILAERRIHRLLVTQDAALVGLLTTFDLVRAVADGRLRPA